MATSRVPAVIDALVDFFEAAPALADVRVIDGPIVTSSPLKEAVYVGYDGDPDGEGQAAESAQEWAGIGQKARKETVTVTCAVVVWHGSTKIRPVRVRAYEVLAAVEESLRTDPSLGLPPPTVAAWASGSLTQTQSQNGCECRIPFQVAVNTRI